MVRSSQGAPAIVPTDHRHLLSLVHLFNQRSGDFPWQTFTLSWSLQPGVWLLRCLCPLSHSLAFSRPLRARWCESSPVPNEEVVATLPLPALCRAGQGSNPWWIGQPPGPPPYHFGQGVSASFTLSGLRHFSRFPLCCSHLGQHRSQGSPIGSLRLEPLDTLSVGFPPPAVPLLDAGHSPLVSLLKHGSKSNSFVR